MTEHSNVQPPFGIRMKIARALGIGLAIVAGMLMSTFGFVWVAFPLPEDILHPGPSGGLVLDTDGEPLLSIVASDDQHRLPIDLEDAGVLIPAAVIAVEDLAFHEHAGVDVAAIFGALRDNLMAGRVVRGASTITMQVAGLKLGHPRTIPGKVVEAFRSLQMEADHDKDEILESWLNLAPFGGNLVGVEAASQGWFGKPARECTLAEAALLVGLPNSPERFRPDIHPEAAMRRRAVVLDRMVTAGLIDDDQRRRAAATPVAVRRIGRAENRRHAGWMAIDAAGRGRAIETTIDLELQSIVESVVERRSLDLGPSCDVAVVLVDHATAEIVALVGSSDPGDPRDGAVNGATALRSPGSALKPFLYAEAFQRRRLSPKSTVDDTSVDFAGWRPRNIDRMNLGPIPAAEALQTSRNLPAILLARDLSPSVVAATLRRCGIDLPIGIAERSGLSIAVGGVEVRPIELAEAYATLARGGLHRDLTLIRDRDGGPTGPERRVFDESTCAAIEWCLAGPETDVSAALPFVAAKTGTSSGHRDAIAAGWNRRWTAVVWAGRFDGGGDPSLLGADASLPILQDLLRHPRLATVRSPRPWHDWSVPVESAMGRVEEDRHPIILHPATGCTLIAEAGAVDLTPEIRAGPTARLFLDGAPVTGSRVRVPPGRHELRVVEPGRPPHAVTFSVARDG